MNILSVWTVNLLASVAAGSECYFLNAYPSSIRLGLRLSAVSSHQPVLTRLSYAEHAIVPCEADTDRVFLEIIGDAGEVIHRLTLPGILKPRAPSSLYAISARCRVCSIGTLTP